WCGFRTNHTSSPAPASRGIESSDCRILLAGSTVGCSASLNRSTKWRRKKRFRSSAKAPSQNRLNRRDKVRAGLAFAVGSDERFKAKNLREDIRRRQGFGVTGRGRRSIIRRYGFFIALAAIPAILFALRRPRFFDRHQSVEISGRFLRQDAAEDRQGVHRHARPGGGRNRESRRKKNGWPLLATKAGAGTQC